MHHPVTPVLRRNVVIAVLFVAATALSLMAAEWSGRGAAGQTSDAGRGTASQKIRGLPPATAFAPVRAFDTRKVPAALVSLPDEVAPVRTYMLTSAAFGAERAAAIATVAQQQAGGWAGPVRHRSAGNTAIATEMSGAGAWGGVSGTGARLTERATTTRRNTTTARNERPQRPNNNRGNSGSSGSSGSSDAVQADAPSVAAGAPAVLPAGAPAPLTSVGGRVSGPSPSPAATPEPLSVLLMAGGLAGVYGLRRRLQ